MDPIASLTTEHRLIERVLQALGRAATLGREGRPLPLELFTDAVAFIRRYADRVHHTKEEVLLFPLLEKAGLPREAGPIGCMLDEHESGRRFTGAIHQAADLVGRGDLNAMAPLCQAADAYAQHMTMHIQKEDGVLFVMARRLIRPEDMEELGSAFARVDAETPGFEASAIAVAARLPPS